MAPILVIPRARNMPKSVIDVRRALPLPLRLAPWKWVSNIGNVTQNHSYKRLVDTADPASTICYFWPNTPTELVVRAKDRGLLVVREMINTYRGTAKKILDEAYDRLGLAPTHGITDESVELEKQELSLYDYIFASNKQVELSLAHAGVSSDRILPTSFGWSPTGGGLNRKENSSEPLTVLFVGSACVRKGLPQLLEAWARSNISGELIIAGGIEEAIKPIVDRYKNGYNVKIVGYISDVDVLYRAADFFVFPTFEEGGPQVTYEAGGAGLPVITTPMGMGRLIKDGINGLVVNAGDVDALSNAITQLASSRDLRAEFSDRIARDAAEFTYTKIGQNRVGRLVKVLASHNAESNR